MVNVENAIVSKYPSLIKYPPVFKKSCAFVAKKLIYQDEINAFLSKYNTLEGLDFIEAVMEYFNFSYSISNKAKLNIPSSGRVVIVANHPLGALDALSLISLVREVRSDVKVMANDILMQIKQLNSMLIPVDNMSNKAKKEQIKSLYEALENDEAVIIFPSGEVSRARVTGIKDTHWKRGFLKFARKTNSPILPVYIEAKILHFFILSQLSIKAFNTFFSERNVYATLKRREF